MDTAPSNGQGVRNDDGVGVQSSNVAIANARFTRDIGLLVESRETQ